MKRRKILLLLSVVIVLPFSLISCTKTQNSPVYKTDCADSLVGVYSGSDYCSSSGQVPYQSSITAGTPTNITFSVLGGATNVAGVLDCGKNTVTIPTQNFPGNYSISGTGTYTANRVIINWSGLYLGTPINCSTTFTR